MKNKGPKIIIIVLVIIVAVLVFRVVFDDKFDDFDNFIETRENYEGGPEKFDEDFQGLVDWEKNIEKNILMQQKKISIKRSRKHGIINSWFKKLKTKKLQKSF